MRSAILVALALSPLMVHAQANKSAQPQAATTAPVMRAGLVQSKNLMLGAAAADGSATANAGAVRISTGVVAPKVIRTANIQSDKIGAEGLDGSMHSAVVSLVVDNEGKPSNLKIVHTPNVNLDEDILAAVRQFRFQPGTLDGQNTSVPVQLDITIQEQN
jgi:TonB family protein